MMLRKVAGRNKKAQSALEFLTTYGWAFLVILIMIGALSYFGVLDPSRFLPDKCLFGAGLGACQESQVTSNAINFKLVNNLGVPVKIQAMGATGTQVQVSGLGTACASPALNETLVPGSTQAGTAINVNWVWNTSTSAVFTVDGCTIAVGERPTVKVVIAYLPVGLSYTKAIEGEVSVKRTS